MRVFLGHTIEDGVHLRLRVYSGAYQCKHDSQQHKFYLKNRLEFMFLSTKTCGKIRTKTVLRRFYRFMLNNKQTCV